MKIAPVSADLLIKLALGVGAVVAVIYVVRRAIDGIGGSAGGVLDAINTRLGQAADFTVRQAQTTFNPASDQNAIYSGVSAIGEGVTGQQGWNLGGALYDATHRDPVTGEGPGLIGFVLNPIVAAIETFKPAPGGRASYDETDRLLARYPAPAPQSLVDYSLF